LEEQVRTAQRVTEKFLNNNYSQELLEDYQKWSENNSCKSYKFFSQVDYYNPFQEEEDYYYNRFKRCVYQAITNLLETQAEKQKVFNYIIENTDDRITSQDKERLREQLFQQEEYINYSQYKILLTELENYYEKHKRYPEEYTELNQLERVPSILPLSPDDNHIHELEIQGENLHFTLKTPDTKNPDSYHDYSETTVKVKIPNHLEKLLEQGEHCKPKLRLSNGSLFLDLPVKLNTIKTNTNENRVLACDLGVSTQVTSSILEEQEEEINQLDQPDFYNHKSKRKLQRLIEERKNTPNNTKQHDDLKEKEKHLRRQIQHDIANHLVTKALANKCETIVLENLSDLQAPGGMASTSRHISHWARGDLLEKIEYKANLVGLNVETVNPWKTSQYCSKCGEHGHTIKASNNHKEVSHGGWFHCPSCGFSGDRDYNACLNVGRVYLSQEDRISQCKPVGYTPMGNHAGFPSKASQGLSDRFASVQPNHQSREDSLLESLAGVKGCKTQVSVMSLKLKAQCNDT
jgi:IS605 OrfB family transposase